MIAILDYDAGNIKSVEKACDYIGQKAIVTRDFNQVLKADKVILPGVGSFGDAMSKLKKYELDRAIRECIDMDKPFLGICLGLQLLFEYSQETPGVEGLGIFKGGIHKIPDDNGLKVPHIGWNDLTYPNPGRLFEGIDNPYVYFVHSFYLKAEDSSIVTARTNYGVDIDASVESSNVFACQFHPEKSGDVGLAILKNFAKI